MNDRELADKLLQSQESNELDFKLEQYRFDNDYLKSQFIKDIVSMANTIRSGSAYILLGVKGRLNLDHEVKGLSQHHDEANLLGILKSRVAPTPRFTYRPIRYGLHQLGIFEISHEQPGVIMPRADFGVLRNGAVYIRKNSMNCEAESDDIARLSTFYRHQVQDKQVAPTGSWSQLHRICDGFDPARVYLAVLDRSSDCDIRDWEAMAAVHWNVIVDFDAGTDSQGNFEGAEGAFRERHALRLTALESQPEITPQSTLWIAALGLQSRPTTQPTSDIRSWNQSKVPRLEQVMNELARITEPAPATLIIFSGETEYVSITCNAADRAFANRIEFVVASQNPEPYRHITERFGASSVTISLPEACQGLREIRPDTEPMTEVMLPKKNGGTASIEPDRVHWVEEHFELVPWDTTTGNSSEEEDRFLKGSTVSWKALNVRSDIDRRITNKLEADIRKELNKRETRRVNLLYRPGAGATTVARRIAWNLHQDFPTAFVRKLLLQETVDRAHHIFDITNLPLLIVIDLPGVTKDDIDRFYSTMRQRNTHAVLFHIERRFDSASQSGHYLDAVLESSESAILSEKLARRVPGRRKALEALVNVSQNDWRRRTAFYFGLEAFGRDFQGIESYVEGRLSEAAPPVHQALRFSSFAYFFGQISLPLQSLTTLFGLTPSTRFVFSKGFPDHVRELLIEEKTAVRPAHHIIAEEILQQELGRPGEDRRNWRNGLADLATQFIDLLAGLPHRERGTISEILRSVLIERDTAESPAGPWESRFSAFLTHVPSVDGRQRVLEHLTHAFPDEPHFWAHLGRFYSQVVHHHEKAHEAHETAIALLPEDPLLHHMAGMGWRTELYDFLDQPRADFLAADEDKAFMLLDEAKEEFARARALDSISEHNYISQIQIAPRIATTVANFKGFRDQTMQFLSLPGNDRYRELIDEAQNLLSDLELVKGSESPSQLQVSLQARLERLYGNYTEAVERLTNVLDRPGSFKPPLRRAIIRSYVSRKKGNWAELNQRELTRVTELASENIEEEPSSDHNLRLWLRAIRTGNTLSVDRVAERLAYKRLQNPTLHTTYYLYIMKFLQLEGGELATAAQLPGLMEECRRLAHHLPRTTTSFEWLGKAQGIAALVHVGSLGEWDSERAFWTNTSQLRTVRGRIAQIRNLGSGEIELQSGIRAFFVPSRGLVTGGYVPGQDVGREVEFILGFSYDGLRAWSVRDPGAGDTESIPSKK